MIIENDQELYKLIKDAYQGSGGFKDGSYLARHDREPSEKFSKRKQLVDYDNNFKNIIDSYITPISSRVVSTVADNAPDVFKRFYLNCNGKDTTVRDWHNHMNDYAYLFGWMMYGFDDYGATAESKAEEVENNIYPKLITIEPSQVIRYELDNFGKITYLMYYKYVGDYNRDIVVYDKGIRQDLTPVKEGDKLAKDQIIDVNKKDYKTNGDKKKAYSNLYVYSLDTCRDGYILPISEHLALTTQAVASYRLDSLANYQNHEATFPLFHCNDESLDTSKFELSELAVVRTREGTVFEPIKTEYIADKISEKSKEIKENMYQNYNLNINISSMASGESRGQADNLRVQKMQGLSTIANTQELRVITRFFEHLDNEVFNRDDYDLRYPTEFSANSLKNLLDDVEKQLNFDGISPESQAELRITALKAFFANDDSVKANDIVKNEELQITAANDDNFNQDVKDLE